VSRRARRNRPPRLPDPEPPRARDASDRRPRTPRGRLVTAHVAGPHASLGRSEVAHVVARLTAGAPDATLGLPLERVSREEAWAALGSGWGWDGSASRASIDPDLTLAGTEHARQRLRAVGAAGGRVALATGHPASLLPLMTAIAGIAVAAGAELLACERSGPIGGSTRELWWPGAVAVVTDGDSLLGDDGLDAAPEWLFLTGRPDLVVADGAFAGVAAAAGHETIGLADLDGVALGVAATRGLPIRVLPLDTTRPAGAYAPLVEALDGDGPGPSSAPGEPGQTGDPAEPPDWAESGDPAARHQRPHSTTRAPGAYAPPQSGGEG
jgi:hypothetical protein